MAQQCSIAGTGRRLFSSFRCWLDLDILELEHSTDITAPHLFFTELRAAGHAHMVHKNHPMFERDLISTFQLHVGVG